jgi:hypothetical protein
MSHRLSSLAVVAQSSSLHFASTVQALGQASRSLGLAVPGFRSPPRLLGVHRSIKRWPAGGATVAVVVRGRPWAAVQADLIEGVVAANGLVGQAADRVRGELWLAVAPVPSDPSGELTAVADDHQAAGERPAA